MLLILIHNRVILMQVILIDWNKFSYKLYSRMILKYKSVLNE